MQKGTAASFALEKEGKLEHCLPKACPIVPPSNCPLNQRQEREPMSARSGGSPAEFSGASLPRKGAIRAQPQTYKRETPPLAPGGERNFPDRPPPFWRHVVLPAASALRPVAEPRTRRFCLSANFPVFFCAPSTFCLHPGIVLPALRSDQPARPPRPPSRLGETLVPELAVITSPA